MGVDRVHYRVRNGTINARGAKEYAKDGVNVKPWFMGFIVLTLFNCECN
jgi:hypothetical protein